LFTGLAPGDGLLCGHDKLIFGSGGRPAHFSGHGDPVHPAVLTLEETIVRFGRAKRNGKRVVFTNGCFDLLHPGHIRSFEAARALGDVLIVGLNSDESVRTLKGVGRPVIPAQERAEILASLECVDVVLIFDDLTPQKVVAALLPDILVKGGDWPGNQIVGREEVEAAGGKVVLVDMVPGYSTTDILKKIRGQDFREGTTEHAAKEC
jgi:rfaE bifunctional protein nucleotidyltransferase chain/domain